MPALNSYLLNAGNYYAHLPKNENGNIPKETLEQHVVLVNCYFDMLVSAHYLDSIIDGLISALTANIDVDSGNYIKQLFVYAIVFHDFGKINERFQVDKMGNKLYEQNIFSNSPIGSSHSSLGAFIYLTRHLNEIITQKKPNPFHPLLITCCIYLSYSIFKHHSNKLSDDSIYTIGFAELSARNNIEDLRGFLSTYLAKYQYQVEPQIIQLIGNDKFLNHPLFKPYLNSFELYAICRLNFSLLTAADYLATNEYMNALPIDDFGVLTKEQINKLYNNVSQREWINEEAQKKNYNKAVYDEIGNHQCQNPSEKSGANLNILRKEMAIEVIRNTRMHYQNNLFFIEAPTGGGKTNLSILATVELLKIFEGKYNKVFYVFPFTTLITQTYAAVKEILGLTEGEIIELHSKAGMKEHGEQEDDNYGDDKLNYINHLFVNYPFCLLSHIRFFDILKTNEKEANYLLHRLANSIVIIDELQSYNPAHWDKVIYFIRQYAVKFNIKFILMSATLPKLDKLQVVKQDVEDFIYLLPDAKKQYFNNPNFSGRVRFNFDLFDRTDLALEELAEKVVEASKEYLSYDFGQVKPVDSVYTIVEFIYKQSSADFYNIIDEHKFFDEIFVLSGTILEHRRKDIINYLKNPANRKRKILLITTQVVEAGVDIDMDLGFKDRSIIDSDEQLAGRINRNVNKEYCTLYLFNYNKESVIYGKDQRFKITREQIKAEEYRRILEQKDFDTLYDKIFNARNEWNYKEMVENFSDYETAIQRLRFRSVHEKFKLIEQKNISCFIPLDIPISIDGTVVGVKETIFSAIELNFLKRNGIHPNENDEISGRAVFDVYLSSIHNKFEFTQQQIRRKVLQSIMSKYVFSIFASNKIENELIHFYDKDKSEYGYMYLERWKDIYSIEQGLDARKLIGIEESQFL
ncbi:hypothetical protein GCM10023143_30290 [Compostibacter hankyongensis]|uniref:CRISPR-associated helicase Cas3 n=1 Tax=Compostibacter hankyongensis TaxID=1007089 RepID=A0ABP8G5K2_9BACT